MDDKQKQEMTEIAPPASPEAAIALATALSEVDREKDDRSVDSDGSDARECSER